MDILHTITLGICAIIITILGLSYISARLKIFELCIFIAMKENIIEKKDVFDYIKIKFDIKVPYTIIRYIQSDLKDKYPELNQDLEEK